MGTTGKDDMVTIMRDKIWDRIALWKMDQLVILLSILYIVVPVGIFFLGWLKLLVSIPLCMLMGFFVYKVHQHICVVDVKLIRHATAGYWVMAVCVCAFWVYLSGIGSLSFQNSDYFVRNPIFRDLSEYSWPVIYDLSLESDAVRQITGDGSVAFSYYYTWWLPAAFLSKLLHFGNMGRNLLLYFWALAGILFILYCMNRFLRKCSYLSLILLIAFSGLDVVGFFLKTRVFPFTEHMEWWAGAGYFQYSSNTTQLFWVCNQSIPVWLAVAVLLQLKDNQYVAAISSLVFAYSPWAAFGMVPVAVAGTFRKGSRIRNAFHVANLMMPLVMLVIYGSFYFASSGSEGGFALLFAEHANETRKLLCNFIVFIFLEAGIYFCIMGKYIRNNGYYKVVLLELLLFPLVYYRDYNFVMRGTIPALFLLMVFAVQFLETQAEDQALKYRKTVLMVALMAGAFTPFTEISRSLTATLSNNDILQEQVYTFGNMRTDDPGLIAVVKNQFFIYDYEDTFFFRYLAK